MSKPAVVVYLGSICNQNCSYCDRDYLKKIGHQILHDDDIPALILFIKKLNPSKVCFHGGEPFLYTEKMEKIIDALDKEVQISILTNGTMLFANIPFLKKYKSRLEISISYDFAQQRLNRQYHINIRSVLQLLEKYQVSVTQLQWVMDPRDEDAFSLKTLDFIADIYSKHKVSGLTILPLRHIRGDRFEVIIDDIDQIEFFKGFLQFLQLLYVLNINVSIDGNDGRPAKSYFDDHKQIVLSPDGYLYPEFDFLDYKIEEARIGSWKTGEVERKKEDKAFALTPGACHDCDKFNSCGIKYLYKNFNQTPAGFCQVFYVHLDVMIEHLRRLNKHRNLLEAVK